MKIVVEAADSVLTYRKPGAAGAGTALYPIDRQGRFSGPARNRNISLHAIALDIPSYLQRRNWIDLVWRKE